MTESASPAKADPADYYDRFWQTGPGTLGGRYLRQFWHPIKRSNQLAPGRAAHVRLLAEDFTLYRGETGTVHMTVHRCPHRKTQLSVGLVEGDAIRCLYHGWKFGADGGCQERPAEGTTGGIAIDTYPVREFLGLIYAYIGGGEPPTFPPYPAFEGEGIVETQEIRFPCNYLQGYENDWDLYHANFTHSTGELHGPMSGKAREDFFMGILRNEHYAETDYGVVRTIPVFGQVNASVLFMPHTVRLWIPSNNELTRRVGLHMRQTYLIHTPVDDETHLAFVTQLAPFTSDAYREAWEETEKVKREAPRSTAVADTIFANNQSVLDYRDYPLLVQVEDLLTQVGQGAIVDRRGEKLGRSDAGVVYFRRLLAREFAALETGRPTKRWTFMHTLPEGIYNSLSVRPTVAQT